MIPFSMIESTIYESLTIIGKYQKKQPNPSDFELYSQKGPLGRWARPGPPLKTNGRGATFWPY